MLLKKLAVCAAAVVMCLVGAVGAQAQDLMITAIVDGTLPGGEPKFAELYAINDIPDLSLYALSRAGNGSGSFDALTTDHVLPAVSLSAGDFYYAVGNSFVDQTGVFDSVFPALTGSRALNFGVNSNGDDVTGLFYDPAGAFPMDFTGVSYIDVVGELGVDGTGTAWEHLDGYLYRKSGGPTTTFDVNNWLVSGVDALDGLDEAGLAAAIPVGTYPIPEPSTVLLTLICGFGLLAAARRRS